MDSTPTVVCVGETMAVLLPERPGPLEDVPSFRHSCGGAEANVARGLVALGVPAAWAGRVGADGFGRRVLRELAAAGVDVRAATTDPDRPTGLYVKEAGPSGSVLHYYRDGSAGSAIGPDLLGDPLFAGARLVHLSGITAALSDSALALTRALLARPRDHLVSFDLNWRPALWRRRDPAVLRPLLDAADIVMLGADEAAAVLGTADPDALRALLPGPSTLVIKDDAHQAIAVTADGTVTEPALNVEVVEPVGAGDAFAAGYLAGTLRGYGPRRRLRLGHLAAAATLVVPGDHGPPPPPDLVEALLAASPDAWAGTTVRATGITRPVEETTS
ncbi:sugar kinase [Actinomadura algeriensis]|uniref:2-dehydro-3-deoxygluconokinase n=1 Tax=Actinomadura algeriensis TaxID=1679523 RepID=A0ABR9JNY2_9ACTN|nr:sugar kinase [Actinomadura algeriensis]MBE1532066.1 2-dehydro-3-deoxygluconokinase [Actinomadura algeriensis]